MLTLQRLGASETRGATLSCLTPESALGERANRLMPHCDSWETMESPGQTRLLDPAEVFSKILVDVTLLGPECGMDLQARPPPESHLMLTFSPTSMEWSQPELPGHLDIDGVISREDLSQYFARHSSEPLTFFVKLELDLDQGIRGYVRDAKLFCPLDTSVNHVLLGFQICPAASSHSMHTIEVTHCNFTSKLLDSI